MAWCLWIPKTSKSKRRKISHSTALFLDGWFRHAICSDNKQWYWDLRTLDILDPTIYHSILGTIVEIGTSENLQWMLDFCKETYEITSYQRWIDVPDLDGYVPLARAVICGNLPCVDVLLSAGSQATKDCKLMYASAWMSSPYGRLEEKLVPSGHWKITFPRGKYSKKVYTAPLCLALMHTQAKGADKIALTRRVAMAGSWCDLPTTQRNEMLVYASRYYGYLGWLLHFAETDIATQKPIPRARTVKYKVAMESLLSIPRKYGSVLHNLTWIEDRQSILDYYRLSLRYNHEIGLIPDANDEYGPLLSVLLPNDRFAAWKERMPARLELFRLFVRMGARLTQDHADRCFLGAVDFEASGIVPMLRAIGYAPRKSLESWLGLRSFPEDSDLRWVDKPMPEELIAEWRGLVYFETSLLTLCLDWC